MRKARITISLYGHSYETTFQTDKPEYVIADEAYRLALIFVKTRIIAEKGYMVSSHEFGEILKDLEYDYSLS